MDKLIKCWKAPTPPKFQKLFRWCIIIAAGAAALLGAEKLGQATGIPDFTFTLLPLTKLICKNLFVAGLVAAAIAKARVATDKLDEVKSDVKDVKQDVAAIK